MTRDEIVMRNGRYSRNLFNKFWGSIDIRGLNDCWLWIGNQNGTGYGLFFYHGKYITAHQMSWIIHRGPIDIDKEICHKCNNRLCVNPKHLYMATHAENMKEQMIRYLKIKSSDGILQCNKCGQIIDVDQQKKLLGLN